MTDRSARRRLRCAIYTRKSSEEGLEQDFNSLDAQREACAAYIASQKHEGWSEVATRYDDGAYSGGTMDRPALQALLADIKVRRIDVVVVYKVDRLTRALADFAKIVEVFDAHNVSFVSVTQAFNTTTSMGRLTLNVLLSFAQFEREVTGERIRDKIAASKKKGMWMGGYVPFGYRPLERSLVIEEAEAGIVRLIFTLYLELGTVRDVEAELERRSIAIPGRTTRAGRIYGARSFSRGQLYKLLSNPIYCGEIRHKGVRHPGQHPAIIAPDTFAQVAEQLAANAHERKIGRHARSPSLLAGLIVDAAGNALIATHANKQGKRYRYYISKALHDGRARGRLGWDHMMSLDAEGCATWRLPATDIEAIVIRELVALLTSLTRVLALAGALQPDRPQSIPERATIVSAAKAIAADLSGPDGVVARGRMLELLSRIEVASDGITIRFNLAGTATALCIEGGASATAVADTARLSVPIVLRRRGVETKLILIDNGRPVVEPDQTMIRALARAQRWMKDLLGGVHGSITELADAYGTNAGYVARHLPLACLSPALVTSILEGRQPVELTTWDLLNRIEIPLDWTEQAHRLGCS